MLINESLREIRFRSFYIGGDLVCEVLVLFFNMSISGWVSLTVGEGVSEFMLLASGPDLRGLTEIDDEFAYPIRSLNGLDKFLGREVLAVYEYKLEGVDEGCVGVYFDFGECGLSVVEFDECLEVIEGVMQYSDGEVSLVRVDVRC